MADYDPAVREIAALLASKDIQDGKPEIREKLEQILEMTSKRHNYADEMTTKQSEILANISRETFSHPWRQVFEEGKTSWPLEPRMISGTVTSQFLKFAVSMVNAKNILEIGMFTGYTALSMAEALPEDGVVITCEVSEYLRDLTANFFSKSPHGNKIQPRFAKAQDTLKQLAEDGRRFELIFIDADKPGYKGYVDTILANNILAPNGIILADNAFQGGRTYNNPSKKKEDNPMYDFCEYIKNHPDLTQVLIPIRDGILAIKRKGDVEGKPR